MNLRSFTQSVTLKPDKEKLAASSILLKVRGLTHARPFQVKIKESTATVGFQAQLWLPAGKLRRNMDAASYKRVIIK